MPLFSKYKNQFLQSFGFKKKIPTHSILPKIYLQELSNYILWSSNRVERMQALMSHNCNSNLTPTLPLISVTIRKVLIFLSLSALIYEVEIMKLCLEGDLRMLVHVKWLTCNRVTVERRMSFNGRRKECMKYHWDFCSMHSLLFLVSRNFQGHPLLLAQISWGKYRTISI